MPPAQPRHCINFTQFFFHFFVRIKCCTSLISQYMLRASEYLQKVLVKFYHKKVTDSELCRWYFNIFSDLQLWGFPFSCFYIYFKVILYIWRYPIIFPFSELVELIAYVEKIIIIVSTHNPFFKLWVVNLYLNISIIIIIYLKVSVHTLSNVCRD